jgi:AraC-like DNA-binding protein
MPVPFLRYLPPDPDGEPWGVELKCAGETVIPPGQTYPINLADHPPDHRFTWETGRVLHEFGLVLVSAGRGQLETRAAGRHDLSAGDLFFLHPGVWHRYRPDPATGWTENWVNFGGAYAGVLMGQFFPPERPVVHLARPGRIDDLLRDLHALMRRGVFAANRGLAVARLLEILASVRQQDKAAMAPPSSARIEKVCMALLGDPSRADWATLAKRCGMSLPHFRRKFQEATGHAPHRYLCRIRINRAKALLRGSDLTTERIAEMLGYTDAAHFSKAFRADVGIAPGEFRKRKDPQA